MCYCPTPTLHLNLALTGDGSFLLSPQKTYSVWFISILNYGDTENVLINHLLLVIPMSYLCHYTNLCPHKPHKHAHTHIHTHTHTHTHTLSLSLSLSLLETCILRPLYKTIWSNRPIRIRCSREPCNEFKICSQALKLELAKTYLVLTSMEQIANLSPFSSLHTLC